jgi:CPA2 family monovalent cation:H+ antiporter-2
LTAIHAIIVLAVLVIIGYFVLNRFFNWIASTHSHEIFIASVLFVAVGSSLIAHSFGFTYSLGAFIAGLMISETHYKYQIEADLTPFRDLLLGVFFVSVGMQVDIVFFCENYLRIIFMVAVIMVLKAVLIYSILKFSHWHITSLKAAISLSQVGEFSFVIFEMAKNRDLISSQFAREMILVVTISMIITPFILNYQDKFLKIFRRVQKDDEPGYFPEISENPLNHIIVIGYGYHGRRVVEHLEEKQIPYVVVEFRRELIDRGRAAGHNVVFGNASQKYILNKAGISTAMAAIIAIEDEKHAVLIAKRIAEIGEHINVVVKSKTEGPFKALESVPGLMVINEQEEIALTLIHYALSCDIKS